MPSTKARIWIVLLASGALGLTACVSKAPRLSPAVKLTSADRTPAADPIKPAIPSPLAQPAATAALERAYLLEAVIRPLLRFSLAQEQATASERQRAAGLVAKIDEAAKITAPAAPGWKFWDRRK